MELMKDLNMEIFMVFLKENHWDEKTEPNWDLHMELKMDSKLVLMKDLSCVNFLDIMKYIRMESFVVHLMGSHWDKHK